MSVPYIGFGNDTLAKRPALLAGDLVDCHKCGDKHVVEGSKPDGFLLFYKCGCDSYLAGIKGRSIVGAKPDVSGST